MYKRQSKAETAEIQMILKKLEEMEQMEDSEELENEIMNTVSEYPELVSVMRTYSDNHGFEKESVEFERLKLEEQISLLEKIIEQGISQTTELREIHHYEVEDLHKQIINLQKQVANHVRFIDDHCVDSEDIRNEMQKDIDRLVIQIDEQEKQTRTTQSLQTQIDHLECEMVQLTTRLASAAESEQRAMDQLHTYKDEKDQNVSDLQNEVNWFRGEYDQLLKKISECENELNDTKLKLNDQERTIAESLIKLEHEMEKCSLLSKALDEYKDGEKEKVEILNLNLEEVKIVAETQKHELQVLKSELEKSKEVISNLKTDTQEESNIDFFRTMDWKSLVDVTAATMGVEGVAKLDQMKEKLVYLETKLERKTLALNDLTKENLRLKEHAERRRRTLKKNGEKLTKSMTDLTKSGTTEARSFDRHSYEEYDSEESGYVASHLGSSSQHVRSASSLLSLDQHSDSTPMSSRRKLRHFKEFGSTQHMSKQSDQYESSQYDSLSPIPNRRSMPNHIRYVMKCENCCDEERTRLSSYTLSECSAFDLEKPMRILKQMKNIQPEMDSKIEQRDIMTQTQLFVTHSVKIQSTPILSSFSCQTSEEPPVSTRERPCQTAWKFDNIEDKQHIATQKDFDYSRLPIIESSKEYSRLEAFVNEQTDEIKTLQNQLRRKDDAFALKDSEISRLKRQMQNQDRELARLRQVQTENIKHPYSGDKHDIAINLREGNDDHYGRIDQIQPGQIQELKTVRKTVKNVNGIPVSYSTKVSVKCHKVAVFF